MICVFFTSRNEGKVAQLVVRKAFSLVMALRTLSELKFMSTLTVSCPETVYISISFDYNSTGWEKVRLCAIALRNPCTHYTKDLAIVHRCECPSLFSYNVVLKESLGLHWTSGNKREEWITGCCTQSNGVLSLYIPRGAVEGAANMAKSARLIASGKAGLCSLLLWHIIPLSVVAFGNIEQISESPSRFITNGQQMVASPIVAVSKGTGMI